MISETVQLRLMTYFFEQAVTDEYYEHFHETLTAAFLDSQESLTEDALVSIGIHLINQYIEKTH